MRRLALALFAFVTLNACSVSQAEVTASEFLSEEIDAVCEEMGLRNDDAAANFQSRAPEEQLAWIIGSILERNVSVASRDEFSQWAERTRLRNYVAENAQRFFESEATSYLFSERGDCFLIRDRFERNACLESLEGNVQFLEMRKVDDNFRCETCLTFSTQSGHHVYYEDADLEWSDRLKAHFAESFRVSVTADVLLRSAHSESTVPFLRFRSRWPLISPGMYLEYVEYVFASDLLHLTFYRLMDEDGGRYCGTSQIDQFLADNYLIW